MWGVACLATKYVGCKLTLRSSIWLAQNKNTNKKSKATKTKKQTVPKIPSKNFETVVVKKKSKEKVHMSQIASVKASELLAENYAKCMLFPYSHASRVPTAYNNKSALIKTRRTFDLTLATRDGVVDPRFAFFVQPKIGDPSHPFAYQIGLVDYSKGANPDLRNPQSYVNIDSGGNSFALDPNSPWITQSKPKAYGLVAYPLTTDNTPLSLANPLVGLSDQLFTVNGQQVTYTYGPDWFLLNAHPVNKSRLELPEGTYQVSMTCTFAAASNLTMPLGLEVVRGLNDIDIGTATRLKTGATGNTVMTNVWSVSLTEGDELQFPWDGTIVGGGSRPTSIELLVTPLCSPNVVWSSNFGLTEGIRPVGCSVLTTCVLPNLTKGGIIKADLFPSMSQDKLLEGAWITKGAFDGNRDFYTGNLSEGNYIWWKPDNTACLDFYSVDVANMHQYPIMCVVGRAPASATAEDIVAEVTVEFVYEILNNTQLLESKKVLGATDLYEAGLRALANVPQHSENPEHSSLLGDIGKIMHEGAKFLPLLSLIS